MVILSCVLLVLSRHLPIRKSSLILVGGALARAGPDECVAWGDECGDVAGTLTSHCARYIVFQSQLAHLVHILSRILQEDAVLGRRLEQVVRELALGGSIDNWGNALKIEV